MLPYPLWRIETKMQLNAGLLAFYLTPLGDYFECKVQRERRGYPRPNYALRIAHCELRITLPPLGD